MNILQIITGSAETYVAVANVISAFLALIATAFLLSVLVAVAEASPVKMAGGVLVSGFFFDIALMFRGIANEPGSAITEVYNDMFVVAAAVTLMTVALAFVLVLIAAIERLTRDRQPVIVQGAAMKAMDRAFDISSDYNSNGRPREARGTVRIDRGMMPAPA